MLPLVFHHEESVLLVLEQHLVRGSLCAGVVVNYSKGKTQSSSDRIVISKTSSSEAVLSLSLSLSLSSSFAPTFLIPDFDASRQLDGMNFPIWKVKIHGYLIVRSL